MATLNVANRTLFIGDNLPILRGINSESVDLIATDPPFNKGVKAFEGITKAGENVSYKDVWTWGDVQAEWTNEILGNHPALYSVIQAANASAGDDMGAFLCWLAVRVLECHRILKPTGSMYLHIDHTAHAYAKAMMDAIFGRKNFRNEIVWAYTGPQRALGHFPRKHDTILFYSKGDKWVFNRDAIRIPSKWNELGGFSKDGVKRKNRGKVPEDWWHMTFGPNTKERMGYPTQKPLAVYERIIKASSNEGDVVLDPFAGCATTCVAAERLGRKWIGIDINEEATGVIRDRLQGEVSKSMAWKTLVKTPKKPPKRTDGGAPAAPELRVISRKRNARRWSVKEVRETLLGENGQRCQGCGWEPPYPDYLQIDHKKPRSLGGADEMDNYTLLCDPCNRLKSNKLTLNELRDVRVEEGRVDAVWWAEERWR
ncbi:MAG: hypothetical protein F4X20_02475 [Dehalococcoidia bacterium]|nr:hypothetical protein [Dehalococcoidia bacterium]